MFDRRYLLELVDHHQSGRRDYSSSLWTLLMFDAFLRNVVDTATDAGLAAKAA
jgi:asparagine synthase (glutamine-hydrolysing)